VGALTLISTAQQSGDASPAPAFPPAPIVAPPSTAKPASLADLAWLQGQWTGAWGPRTATQVWSAPRAGTMLGTLQIVESNKTSDVELLIINQMSTGVEYRVLHFTPSLEPWEKSGPAILFLTSADSKKFVFQNQGDGEPQKVVLTRTDPDAYTNHWEILHEGRDPLTYDIVFHRQKANAGNAASR
jgi:hypothetical protein